MGVGKMTDEEFIIMPSTKSLAIAVIIIFLLIVSMFVLEHNFATKPVRQACKDFGYEGAYHSNRGWLCWKEENGLEISASYLDLKEAKE